MSSVVEEPSYKLGILGASNIAVPAMLEPARVVDKVKITAIANRTLAKAEAMAEAYQIPNVAGSLDELLELDELDGVYIALSNELHAQWAIRALNAGKHVLVEKPICLHPEEAEQLRLAKNNPAAPKLAEGLMIACHPWQQALKGIVDSGEFGALRRISTRISVPAKNGHAGNYRSVRGRAEVLLPIWAATGCSSCRPLPVFSRRRYWRSRPLTGRMAAIGPFRRRCNSRTG